MRGNLCARCKACARRQIFALTDRILVSHTASGTVLAAIDKHREYIAGEVLAVSLATQAEPVGEAVETFEIADAPVLIAITRRT